MTSLERRYRWLLKAYPRPYREYRADEILEILLAGDHKRRPSVRESWALVVGGLRERAGVNHLDTRGLRRSSLRLSALALLILGITLQATLLVPGLVTVGSLVGLPRMPVSIAFALGHPAGLAQAPLVIAAMLSVGLIATAWARYGVAFATTVLAAAGQCVVSAAAGPAWPAIDVRFWASLLVPSSWCRCSGPPRERGWPNRGCGPRSACR